MMIRICYVIIYILEACILWQYCRKLFPSKFSTSRNAIVLIICYSILLAGSMYENPLANFILFLVINLLYIYLMYDLKFLIAFFHSFYISIIMILSELGVISIISFFTPDFYNELTYFRNLMILTATSKLLYFIILETTALIICKIKTKELIADRSTLFLMVIPVISGFVALVMAAICMNVHLSLMMDIMITISAILLLAINIFLAWFHTNIQEKNQQFMEMQLQLQKEQDNASYFDALHKQDEQQKILIHDIRRHLSSIADLSKQENSEKITEYINQIIQSSNLQETIRVCDNPRLNTIVLQAKQHCKEHNIKFITDIRSCSVDYMTDYDITSLFSNLLDNAMEAVRDIPDAFIDFSVTPEGTNQYLIALINSCKVDPFSGKRHELITTKQNKLQHGYGIKSIQRITKKYAGHTNFYYRESDSTFHSLILLRNHTETQSH